ncbi:MAG TPA: hypothetical protein HA230_00300 [Candidatus Aenigmarchaeota archaeon]|nr:hypothetical protein [Candidatus Aenigmarchaeota archaeon]
MPNSTLADSVVWIFIIEFLAIHSTAMFGSPNLMKKGIFTSRNFLLIFYLLFGFLVFYISGNYIVMIFFFISIIGKFIDKSIKLIFSYIFRFGFFILTAVLLMSSGLGLWGVVYYSGIILFQIFVCQKNTKTYTGRLMYPTEPQKQGI